MSNTKTYVIHGTAHWCKLLGPARENNFGEKQWSVDVTPDEDGIKLLKEIGLIKRLKDPREGDNRTAPFLTFRQNETKADGTPAEPIRVVNAATQPWTKEMGLIGNGSEVNVKFVKKDYGPGKHPGLYIRAMQVVKLVPYESQDFEPIQSDEAYFAELPEGMEPVPAEDLNDDIPE